MFIKEKEKRKMKNMILFFGPSLLVIIFYGIRYCIELPKKRKWCRQFDDDRRKKRRKELLYLEYKKRKKALYGME